MNLDAIEHQFAFMRGKFPESLALRIRIGAFNACKKR